MKSSRALEDGGAPRVLLLVSEYYQKVRRWWSNLDMNQEYLCFEKLLKLHIIPFFVRGASLTLTRLTHLLSFVSLFYLGLRSSSGPNKVLAGV